jgi:hypothetical protein
LLHTSAWITKPEGGSKDGIVAVGGSLPGQIQIIPSFSKHGIDFIFTFSIRVDGIFSHFPSVLYSQPDNIQPLSNFRV